MSGSKIADSFETIEGITKAAATAANQGVSDIGGDIVEAITGNAKPLPSQQQQQIKQNDATRANQIRQNIALIDKQIVEIRKKRDQDRKQEAKNKDQQKQAAKFEEKKKDSVLQKLIKSRKGTKEGMQRASG